MPTYAKTLLSTTDVVGNRHKILFLCLNYLIFFDRPKNIFNAKNYQKYLTKYLEDGELDFDEPFDLPPLFEIKFIRNPFSRFLS